MTKTPQDGNTGARGRRTRLLWLVATACFAGVAAAADPAPAAAEAAPVAAAAPASVFARVADTVISHEQFDAAFAQAARGKFYHGKPPEGAVAALQREIGQTLVDQVLLLKEAARRQIQPDAAAVAKTLEGYEERYRTSAQWVSNRERLLPGLRAKLERDSVMEQLTAQVKQVGEPTPEQLQQYWERHQDKFTTPEQVRLSMILLPVDPSSPQTAWDAARQQGADLVRQLRTGADFAELAKAHSRDQTGPNGGDMGLVHVAMLPDAAQEVVKKLQPGEFSDATFLLEGIAIFRVEGRRESTLNPLDAVRERARGLWERDTAQEQWQALLAQLRLQTPATLDDSRFLPLKTAGAADEKAGPR